MKLVEQIKAALRVSVPLVSIDTPDPAATVAAVQEGVNGDRPKMQWDIVRGVLPLNDLASDAIARAGGAEEAIMNPVGAMTFASKLPQRSMLFVLNASRYLDDSAFIQAVWNLRDQFKQSQRMVILLSPSLRLPPELTNDVVSLSEPLPDQERVSAIIQEVHAAAALEVSEDTLLKATAATTGLPAFQVEQLTAMSLTPDGLVLDDLWERKCRQIEQTPGLSVYRGGETFDSIGGVAYAKMRFYRICVGRYSPQAIIWIDEIDKQMAGEGDLSGISQDQLGAMLTYMETKKVKGILCVGPPGCAKSLIAQAAGNEAGIKTIGMDFGAMKGGIVGQSETQMRDALKVISSVSNERPLFVATCNRTDKLNTALMRRFPTVFYFDLPTREEKEKIWPIHVSRLGIAAQDIPNDDLWAGADIRNCCESAWEEDISLLEAATGIVPVGIRSALEIEALRQQANGTYISASHGGIYRRDAGGSTGGGRKFNLN